MIEAEFRSATRSIPQGAVIRHFVAPDGWPLRVFEWPSGAQQKSRGSILFQSGRADFFEKYLEFFHDMHSAGWAIAAFDWRGQGGSGRLLEDKLIGHTQDFGVWTADLAAFWKDWTARSPGPHILIGHSMGGHLSLRTVMEYQLEPDALILVAPMLGFKPVLLPQSWVGLATRFFAWLFPRRRAWPDIRKPSDPRYNRQPMLTHDVKRYSDEQWWREKCPELTLGAPSLSWVAQAYLSFGWMLSERRLDALKLPILIVATDADRLVSASAIRRFAARMNDVRLKIFGREAAHELLRESDFVRGEVIDDIDIFLDERAPSR